MTLGDVLTERAATRPQALALIDERAGRRLTFAELENAVGCAAAWWQARGLKRGQAVLVFVPMSVDLYIALLALFRLGAVALFLDPSAGRAHLERCCARWEPHAFLAVRKAHLLRIVSTALRRIPLKISVAGWFPASLNWPRIWLGPAITGNAAEPNDPALVTFTSGSTGVPKAAVRTHAFLLAQHRALAPSVTLEAGEVDLATLPVFVFANLAAGVTTVISRADLRRPGAVDATTVLGELRRHAVTRITASPAFFERIVEEAARTNSTNTFLTKLYTGGAPVFPRLLDRLQNFAPQARVVAVYGSTEAEPIAHIDAAEMTSDDLVKMRAGRGLLAGVPVKEVRIHILRDRWGTPRGEMTSEDFSSDQMRPGEAGEIVLTGDHVLKGYLGGVGEEETKFRVNGEVWHRTGDAGWLDEEGRLWLLGRCSARVQDTRGSLYSFGVECVAMTFLEVRRAAFIAQGASRLLLVEGEPNVDLIANLREYTKWAQIDGIRFVPKIPVDKRHNAKIDYVALRKLVTSSSERTFRVF